MVQVPPRTNLPDSIPTRYNASQSTGQEAIADTTAPQTAPDNTEINTTDGANLSPVAGQNPDDGPPANVVSFPPSGDGNDIPPEDPENTGENETVEESDSPTYYDFQPETEPSGSEWSAAYVDALGNETEAILQFVSKIKDETDKALLDMMDAIQRHAEKLHKQYQQYVHEVLIPREQAQKQDQQQEQVQTSQDQQAQQQDIAQEVRSLQGELQQVFNRLASISPAEEADPANAGMVQQVERLQSVLTMIRRDLGE